MPVHHEGEAVRRARSEVNNFLERDIARMFVRRIAEHLRQGGKPPGSEMITCRTLWGSYPKKAFVSEHGFAVAEDGEVYRLSRNPLRRGVSWRKTSVWDDSLDPEWLHELWEAKMQ